MSPNGSHPVLSLQLYVKMGSCKEQASEAGYSHFLEHLVFKSTEKYPDNQLTERAMFLGSNINAYTEFDSTCFYLTLSSLFLAEGLDILSQLCRYANFSRAEFKYEKKVVLEEIAFYENDPEDCFIEQIPALYFKQSPYKRPIIGSKESISQADYEELTKFYKEHYTPENCFLVVSGDFNVDELATEAEKFFGDWQRGENKSATVYEQIEYPDDAVIGFVDRKITKPMIAFTLPEVSNAKNESHTLDLVSRIFANGKKSRLYKKLFIEEKLVDQIRMESFSGINDGLSVIIINPKSDSQIETVVSRFLEEFHNINSLEKSEIEETKTEMNHSHRYALEFAKGIGFSLGVEEILGDYRNFANYLDIIDSIKDNEVQQIVKETYQLSRLGVFVLSAEDKNRQLQPKIKELVAEYKKGISSNQHLQAVGNQNEGQDNDFRKIILDSGCELLLKRVQGKPTIGITAAIKVSQLDETTASRGINHLASVLLLYGNEKMTYQQLLDYCSQHGIQLSVSTADEATLIKIKCFPEHLQKSLEILADLMNSSLFPPEHFLNIQQTIISNIERMKDYPSQYAVYLWKKQFFGKDSVLLDREGTKGTLRKITRKQVVNWYNQHYLCSNMTIAIAGDISYKQITSFCNKMFSGLSKLQSGRLQTISRDTSVLLSGQKFKRYKSEANNGAVLHIGGLCCPASQVMENTAFYLLAQILGGDINSRLYDELREKRGLAYNVGFGINSLQHLGFYAAYAIVDKKSVREVIAVIKKIFRELIDKGITDEELIIAKNSVRGQRLRTEESVSAQASTFASLNLFGYDYEFYLQREERLQSITKDDIVKVAAKYLLEEDLYIHLLV